MLRRKGEAGRHVQADAGLGSARFVAELHLSPDHGRPIFSGYRPTIQFGPEQTRAIITLDPPSPVVAPNETVECLVVHRLTKKPHDRSIQATVVDGHEVDMGDPSVPDRATPRPRFCGAGPASSWYKVDPRRRGRGGCL
jgi:hypothetical protein